MPATTTPMPADYCNQNGHNYVTMDHQGLVSPTDANTFVIVLVCLRCADCRTIHLKQ